MRTRWRNEADDWTTKGSKINDAEKLEIIRRTIQTIGPVIIQHWHYRGGRAPDRFVFDDYDEFLAYLEESCFAGDAIDVWSFAELCKAENYLTEGKCPDDNGLIPKRGAY